MSVTVNYYIYNRICSLGYNIIWTIIIIEFLVIIMFHSSFMFHKCNEHRKHFINAIKLLYSLSCSLAKMAFVAFTKAITYILAFL